LSALPNQNIMKKILLSSLFFSLFLLSSGSFAQEPVKARTAKPVQNIKASPALKLDPVVKPEEQKASPDADSKPVSKNTEEIKATEDKK
jgi:hypothetical protein